MALNLTTLQESMVIFEGGALNASGMVQKRV